VRGFQTFAAALLLAFVVPALYGSDEETPPLTVAVNFRDLHAGSELLPVQFLAPMVRSAAADEGSWRLDGGPAGEFVAQAFLVRMASGERGCAWYEVRSLLPRRDATYMLVQSREPLPEKQPLVVTLNEADRISLDTGQMGISFDKKRFDFLNEGSVFGHTIVPRYVTDLVNRQQSVELTLTDRIRHADFTLKSEPNPAYSLEEVGPVSTTVLCKGAFAGGERLPKMEYEARITLAASGVIGLNIRLVKGSYDPAVMKAKSIKVTLPLFLQRAAALSFGGTAACVSGRGFWTGQSHLAVPDSGPYEFTDADRSFVTGAQKVTWAVYGDDEGGVGMIWGSRQLPAELTVGYSEDLLELSLTPLPGEDSPAEVTVYFVFHPLFENAATLIGTAAAMDNPPEATVNEEYLRAVTGAK
jgi:hypothetical protein